MSETPGKRRRKGREEFEPGVDPMDLQPYKPGTWAYRMHLSDWLEGWEEARVADEQNEDEKRICPHCGQTIEED